MFAPSRFLLLALACACAVAPSQTAPPATAASSATPTEGALPAGKSVLVELFTSQG